MSENQKLREALQAIRGLLNNIRRDAPQLSGKAMGYAEQVAADIDQALAMPTAAPVGDLPELPEPAAWRTPDEWPVCYQYTHEEPDAERIQWAARYGRKHEQVFTADQMRAYARAALSAGDAGERELFEQFAQNCPMGKYNVTRRGEGYDSSHTQIMWDAWQAGRAALRAKAWTGVDAQQLRAGFAAPSQEPVAEQETLVGLSIHGKELRNENIVYDGGPLDLTDCKLLSCYVEFSKAAARTVQFLAIAEQSQPGFLQPLFADAVRLTKPLQEPVTLTDEERQQVFKAAENRMMHGINLSWRTAIVDEVIAALRTKEAAKLLLRITI